MVKLKLTFPVDILPVWSFLLASSSNHRSQWPRCLRHGSAAARLLGLWVRIPPGAWMSVCCECCVLSGRSLCGELITRPEESYRLRCVVLCNLETSWMRRPWPAGGCCAKKERKKEAAILRRLIPLCHYMINQKNMPVQLQSYIYVQNQAITFLRMFLWCFLIMCIKSNFKRSDASTLNNHSYIAYIYTFHIQY